MNQFLSSIIAACLLLSSGASAFAPVTTRPFGTSSISTNNANAAPADFYKPAALQRQRYSVAPVQTMGLFGLGAPEIGIILVAAAFLLGPEKLASLGKDAGKIAGELKEVPKEFQKGLEEGEAQAAALKAKDVVKVEEKKSD